MYYSPVLPFAASAALKSRFEITCYSLHIKMCERNICVHGYHVYRALWDVAIDEDLVCKREPSNECDRYAVAVKKDGVFIGHLPWTISQPCSLFLRRGSNITCDVTGHRRYSADLPQ